MQGVFGTTDPNAKIVKDNADKLLWSQAVDLPETYGDNNRADLGKKADAYKDVAKNVEEKHPGTYPLFQGKNWENRLGVAFGGLLAAIVAGVLIMVIAIALIVVKIAFLLLLVAGPIFLGIGIHPGIGRVIAIRWLELLLSMLLKQAALIGVLSLLLWAYGLILGETLPWGLQILLIALVTFAAFVYRRPFQHLFSAVGYGAVGSREKSEAMLDRSASEARRSTIAAVAPFGGAGLARWAKREATSEAAGATAQRDTQPGTAVAAADRRGAGAAEGPSPEDAPVLAARPRGAGTGIAARQGRPQRGAPPLNLPSRAAAATDRRTDGNGPGGPVEGVVVGGGKSSPGAGSGAGTKRPPSWTGRGGSGGGVSGGGNGGSGGGSGGSGGSGGNGRGGGGGWFGGGGGGSGGRSPGAAERGRGRGGSGNGGGGGGSGGSGGGSNIPRQRGGAGGAPSRSQPGGERRTPPPLWGRGGSQDGPSLPFWLRPVDRPSGEAERDD
ncbi:hypothetical protein E1264_32145 [Actinomadura sp. KC216]|nr:hypothetical protein E1264_32145 [Actinomadura sp. KC216]